MSVSSLGTAAGTLVLAVATFASVRSSHRAAQATERALLAGIRPVLVPSRPHDPPELVGFADNHRVEVGGGRAIAEVTDDAIYFAIALRNVGNGLAVLDRWDLHAEKTSGSVTRNEPENFRRLTRDIYVAAGDQGFWQGSYRDQSDPDFAAAHQAIAERRTVTVDLLYGDHEGGQRTITRFALIPDDDDSDGWMASASRHWNLDRADPR